MKNLIKIQALEKLKEVTGNKNLNEESIILNEFGKELKVSEEINDYIDYILPEFITDLESIDTQLDKWFCDYSIYEILENENVEIPIESIENTLSDAKKVKDELNYILNKIDNKVVQDTSLNNEKTNIKDSVIKAIKQVIENIKKSIDDIISKFENKLDKLKQNQIKAEEKIDKKQVTNGLVFDTNTKINLCENKILSPDILDILSKDSEPRVVKRVAMHPNTEDKTLDFIARNISDLKILETVVEHKNISAETLDYLSNHKDRVILCDIAKHKNTSAETLSKLSKHKNLGVLLSVASNPNTPFEDLQRLSKMKDEKIEEVLSKNENYILDRTFKLPQNKDNENLFLFLKSETNIRKSEIINLFEKEQVFESEDKKAIFPLKDKVGNIVGGFEIDIYNGEKEAKLIENSDLKNVALKDVEYTKSLIEYIVEDIEEQKTLENVSEQEI